MTDATRCHVADFTLAPKGGALLRDGTFAAATVQGITAAQLPRADAAAAGQTAALTLVPLPKGTPGALVGAAPGRTGVFAWISADRSGRLILRRSSTAGEDVVGSVAGAEHVFALDQFFGVVTADGDVHLFLVPPALLDARDDGDAVPRLEPLGVVPTPGGAPDQYIGVATSAGAADGTAAVAIFAHHPENTLHVTAVALSGPAPAVEAWTSEITMPTSGLPVSWAVSSDASTVVVVPEAGHSPMVVQSTGAVATDAIARTLAPANGNVVGVSAVSGTGFVFALRPKGAVTERVDLVLLPSANALSTVPAGGVTGLTMKRATTVSIGTRRSPHGTFHCRVLVGRALYAPALHLPSAKAAAGAAPTAEAPTAPAGPSGTLGLLAAMAAAPDAALPGSSAAVDDATVVDTILAGKALPAGTVLRDPGCSPAAPTASHAVVDALAARAAGDAHAAVARYFAALRDVDASTVVHALLVLVAGVTAADSADDNGNGASPKRGGKKGGKQQQAGSGAKKGSPSPAEAAVAAGHILSSSAEKTRGSVAAAWKAAASPEARTAAAPAVFTALHAVLLHALAGGRLGVVDAATKVMDAVVSSDVDALLAGCGPTLRDAQELLATVGAWASSEPGFRLGQLTAHCGPEFALTKEPQVAPVRGHRIHTAATVRVDHERQAL